MTKGRLILSGTIECSTCDEKVTVGGSVGHQILAELNRLKWREWWTEDTSYQWYCPTCWKTIKVRD